MTSTPSKGGWCPPFSQEAPPSHHSGQGAELPPSQMPMSPHSPQLCGGGFPQLCTPGSQKESGHQKMRHGQRQGKSSWASTDPPATTTMRHLQQLKQNEIKPIKHMLWTPNRALKASSCSKSRLLAF